MFRFLGRWCAVPSTRNRECWECSCRTIQITGGGRSAAPASPEGLAGSPRGGKLGSAGFLFFGSRAVNSKIPSGANHGAADAKMPTKTIAHNPAAITMLRRVILIAETSCSTVLTLGKIPHPITEINHELLKLPLTAGPSRCCSWALSDALGPRRWRSQQAAIKREHRSSQSRDRDQAGGVPPRPELVPTGQTTPR